MPWEPLSSVLSRLRHPGRPRPTPEQDNAESEAPRRQVLIDRKIVQDPSSLLDPETEVQDALPRGLPLSTRLPSADSSNMTRSRTGRADLSPEPLSERDDVSARTQSRIAIGHVSKIAASSEWSTFGRKRGRRVPAVAGLSVRTSPASDGPRRTSQSSSPAGGGESLSADSSPSTFTLSRITNRSRRSGSAHEGYSSPSPGSLPQSPDIQFGSNPSSPANTMSSRRHPQTPQRLPSSTALLTSSTTHSAIPANREQTFDSPHTFGHPTPLHTPADSPAACPFPPPPLPPLDHPVLVAAASRKKPTPTGRPTVSAFRDRSNTLPTHRQLLRRDDLFAPLSLRLGHLARHQPTLPQPRQVLENSMAEQHGAESPSTHSTRQRARTVSGDTRGRRTSADWSAYQATAGVNSRANQAWPAQVSREILRLSLTGPVTPSDTVPGSSGKYKAATRGRSTDPVSRSNRGVASPSFLPFPHPSRPTSSSPSRASATLPDGRGAIPYRPHSLQFDLDNRKASERPGRFTMAEVKRSLSAIGTRNGMAGSATYPSSGLGDPAPAQAPQASHPSSVLTTSRSLFSGRVSPLDTPMSSSTHVEPSTPTPVSRQLSERSRGKRKAEDNIDITPPEQKKEGQRATFLLPSQTRSQRVSNSSHAPSSYHRKRARLSATSPFTTPAQSRASSVHETSQSTSRIYHSTSLSSSTGARVAPPRTPSRAASTRSRQPPTPSTTRRHERRQSMSQASIPISAFISPHAPSISRSAKFHMRDPRKPPKKPNHTPWGLRFATEDEPGSPMQAWCFFFGFLLFPIWWIAGLFLRVPTTRIAGDVDAEKGVPIDDPQIEHDARIWRFRCRVMTVVSFFTYVPFIVLVAIFAPR